MIVATDDAGAEIAFAAFNKTSSSYSSQKPTCTHCPKIGYDITNCYQLVGFPNGWEKRKPGGSMAAGQGRDAAADIGEEEELQTILVEVYQVTEAMEGLKSPGLEQF